MSDTDRQKITTAAEYAELSFQLYGMQLRQAEKRLMQRKARDNAVAKIIELVKIQGRLNKRRNTCGYK